MARKGQLHFARPITHRAMDRDWRMLCERIGERQAGSAAETQAAQYIARELRAAGLRGMRPWKHSPHERAPNLG